MLKHPKLALSYVAAFCALPFAGCIRADMVWSGDDANSSSTGIRLKFGPAGGLKDAAYTTTVGKDITPSPQVYVVDADGNTITDQDYAVSLNVYTDAACTVAESHGPLTAVNSVSGVATFNNLNSKSPGTYYLIATAEGAESSDCSKSITFLPYFGTGQDGSITVSTTNTLVNSYSTVLGSVIPAGSNALSIGTAGGFSAGDLILIAQMQSQNSLPLRSEFATIQSVSAGTTLALEAPLRYSYVATSADVYHANTVQIVKVPQYKDVTINAGASIVPQAWNGTTGGIVAFRAAGIVNVNGAIDAKGMGFRGGAGVTLASGASVPTAQAWQGESILGLGTESNGGERAGAGGGGYINTYTVAAKGGPGSYGTLGYLMSVIFGAENTAYTAPGQTSSSTVANNNLQSLLLGPGGGGLAIGTNLCSNVTNGGNGGGVVLIDANTIVVGATGIISAKGQSNIMACGIAGNESGPGAGGSIYVRAAVQNYSAGTAYVLGGNMLGYPGNFAGSGIIRVDYNQFTGDTTPTPMYRNSPISGFNPLDPQYSNSD